MTQRAASGRRRRAPLMSIAAICAISLPAAAVVAASPSSAEDKFAGGKKVSQSAVAGDNNAVAMGPGDAQLVDGEGATWFFNTNVTFATTSSASAAASEASFLQPTVASTVGGGTAPMGLSDAFDGYNSLSTFVGASPTFDTALRYNQLGVEPTTECGGRQLVYPVQANGALSVNRKVFVPADAGYARWTNTVTNTSNAATTATLYITGNLGSDSRTDIFGSSSADFVASPADTWIGTWQDNGASNSPDPRIGHVLRGNSAPQTLIETDFRDLDDDADWTYQVTLQPGQTKSLLSYTVLRGTKAAAGAAAQSIAAQAPYVCMTHTEANQVANFTGLGAAPTLSLPTSFTQPATDQFGAVVTYSATARDGNNQPVPVTCTPASGSKFTVGTTTVTCTATDPQGRTSTGSFTVTVTPRTEKCDGQTVTIFAQPGGAVTAGTPVKDVILGTPGNDHIVSVGGKDIICGLGGKDEITAGLGNDRVFAGGGDDTVRGLRGNDTVVAGPGNDLVRGDDGDDVIRGNGGKDRLKGNEGDDKLSGGGGNDRLAGNRGDDKLKGGGGKDRLRGGAGADRVDGQPG